MEVIKENLFYSKMKGVRRWWWREKK